MIESIIKLIDLLNKSEICFSKKDFAKVLQSYSFYLILENKSLNEDEKQQINQNIKASKIIIFYQSSKETDQSYIIVGFEKTLIILDQSTSTFFLHNFLSYNAQIPVCFVFDTKNHVIQNLKIKNPEIESDPKFEEEIRSFNSSCYVLSNKVMAKAYSVICSCITGYLIKKSYFQLNKHRFEQFINDIENNHSAETISENEYVELRAVGNGSSFSCVLVYHIKRCELYVIKKPISNDIESRKLIEREAENYKKVRHPLFPKFYGRVKSKNLGVIYYKGEYVTHDINKAIHYFSLAANQNNSEAQFSLGVIYDEGKYVTRDINKAIHYYSLAANQNHPQAQFNLGVIYSEGKYVTRNINKAIYYFSLAANQNHPQAQLNLGIIYFDGQYITSNIDKAIHYCSLAANKNDPQAQYILGVIYYKGGYVTHDINKAIHYFSLAANQNNSEAQFSLGVIYDEGKYVTRDINKAIHYYSLAANQNDSKAQYNLGVIYSEGKYDTLNINKAIHYYSLAANQNDSKAQYNLGVIYSEGKYVTRNINKAIHYFSLAANQNHSLAQLNLGIIFYNSRNSIQDIKKGRYYIMLASKNGCREANFVHGFLLHEGKNIEGDILEAIHYYKEASSFNIQYAKNNLGIIYRHGFGELIPKRVGSSIEYFEEAIRQKNDYLSMYNLAHLYIYEENIKKDIDKSIDLLFKSSFQFPHSMFLLCLLLVKQFGIDIDTIKTEIGKRNQEQNDLSSLVIGYIIDLKLLDQSFFDELYELYRTKEFLYDAQLKAVKLSDLQSHKSKKIIPKYPNAKDITLLFYEGFGF